MATRSDGSVIVGGEFSNCGGVKANNVALYRPATGVWESLGTGASNGTDSVVHAVEVWSEDVYVGGWFDHAGGQPMGSIAVWRQEQWQPLGSASNNGFNGPNDRVYDLVVHENHLYVGGWFGSVTGVPANNIARWDGNGGWSVLGSGSAVGANGQVIRLLSTPVGVVASGHFSQAGGQLSYRVARWHNGSWNAYSDFLNTAPTGLAWFQGQLHAGGQLALSDNAAARVIRWDGQQWKRVGLDPGTAPLDLATDGTRLYAAGAVNSFGGLSVWDGRSWTEISAASASTPCCNRINRMQRVSARWLVSGGFGSLGNVRGSGLMFLDGTAWSPTAAGTGKAPSEAVYQLAVDGSGVYATGPFHSAGGVEVNHIAHWDGDRWSALVEGQIVGLPSTPSGVLVEGQDVYVAGFYPSIGGRPFGHVARWDGQGWNPLPGESGVGVPQQAYGLKRWNGELIVAFYGTSFDNSGNLLRWNGSQWRKLVDADTQIAGVDNSVFSMVETPQGLLFVGAFQHAGGKAANGFALWDGVRWTPVGSPVSTGSFYPSAAVQTVTGAWIGGRLDSFGRVTGYLRHFGATGWSTTIPDLDNPVSSLVMHEGQLFIGGAKHIFNLTRPILWRWDGQQVREIELQSNGGYRAPYMSSLASTPAGLLVAGRFVASGEQLPTNLATWRLQDAVFANGLE